MISSLSQSLVNNPYNVPVTAIQKRLNTEVTSASQASSQSNTYSTAQQNSQAPATSHSIVDSGLNQSMSIHELEHTLTNVAQESVNEASASIQAQKESVWQLGVQQHYVDSQKAALNAYVVSATGESIDDTSQSLINNAGNEGLTEKYMALVEQQLKLKYGDTVKPDRSESSYIAGDDNIQTVPETISQLANQQVINQYNGVQHQGRSSLLHLSA